MSDNVTPLHPERARGKKIGRRVVSLVGVVVVVALALCLILFHQELNLDKLRRYVTYLGKESAETYGEFTYDAHSANAYHAFNNGLALASVAGLSVFDPYGVELCTLNHAMSVPAIAGGSKTVLAYDVGGTALCAANAAGDVLLDQETDAPLLDADISGDDQICYATAAEGYKTVLTVLDQSQQQTYQWLSTTQYLPLCAISDGGKNLVCVSLGQTDGAFSSSAVFFATDQEEPLATLPLGDQLIYDLDFLDAKTLCAVGETGLSFLSAGGTALGDYSYGASYLKDFSLQGSGFVALSLNQYQAGNRFSIATVDKTGRELANLYLGEEVLSLSAAGNYVAVLSAGTLRIYTSDLTLYSETDQVFGASDVAMRSDGSAILIGSGAAKLYLP